MESIVTYINEANSDKPAKFCSKARMLRIMKEGEQIKDKTERSEWYAKYCADNFLSDMNIKFVETIQKGKSYRVDYFVFEYKGVKFVFKSGENWVHDESYFTIYGQGNQDEGSKGAKDKDNYNNDYIWRKATPRHDFSGTSRHISILFNKENIEKTKEVIKLVCEDYCYDNPYNGSIPKISSDRSEFKHGDPKIFR